MRVRKTETNTRVIPWKKAVLKNFAIFPEKHLCWSLYLKRDLNTGVFCVTILKNICKPLELKTFGGYKDNFRPVYWFFLEKILSVKKAQKRETFDFHPLTSFCMRKIVAFVV